MLRRLLGASLVSASFALAQGDLANVLQSQPDLSRLLGLIKLTNLNSTLSNASNITIVAPTNAAFDELFANDGTIPEAIAITDNDVTAIGALLRNHVFTGFYDSSSITNVPTFAQTLLTPEIVIPRQPFTGFNGGQYNGFVRNGQGVNVISGELTVSNVTQADIRLGPGIVIHKIDKVLRFGPPVQLFLAKAQLRAMDGALEAANLGLNFGEGGNAEQNVRSATIFVPSNEAFENIGSVVASANQSTLQEVLKYHIIEDNVVFSPSLGNVTIPTLQGGSLSFTVFPDGSAFVNGARITFANAICYNAVVHIIDGVLNPLVPPPNRASIDRSAPATSRIAFAGASRVSSLPLTQASFTSFLSESYTTPSVLLTGQAVATGSTVRNASTPTTTYSTAIATGAGAKVGEFPAAMAMAVGAMAMAL